MTVILGLFESSVNLQGSKTTKFTCTRASLFESSVNLQGSKTEPDRKAED